jgi:putrescine transport system ATP-binding protein
VADFIGTINTFEGAVTHVSEDSISVEADEAGSELRASGTHQLGVGQKICIAIRPEKIFLSKREPDNDDDTKMGGVVEDLGYFGNISLYRIRLGSGKIIQVSAQNRTRSARRFLEWDDEVWVSWSPRSAVVLKD